METFNKIFRPCFAQDAVSYIDVFFVQYIKKRKNIKISKMFIYLRREDYELAANIKSYQKRREFYNNVKAGAESGWDFSARWFVDETGNSTLDFQHIATEDIIPVDLNALLERNARILARYFARIGNKVVSSLSEMLFIILFFIENNFPHES